MGQGHGVVKAAAETADMGSSLNQLGHGPYT